MSLLYKSSYNDIYVKLITILVYFVMHKSLQVALFHHTNIQGSKLTEGVILSPLFLLIFKHLLAYFSQ